MSVCIRRVNEKERTVVVKSVDHLIQQQIT